MDSGLVKCAGMKNIRPQRLKDGKGPGTPGPFPLPLLLSNCRQEFCRLPGSRLSLMAGRVVVGAGRCLGIEVDEILNGRGRIPFELRRIQAAEMAGRQLGRVVADVAGEIENFHMKCVLAGIGAVVLRRLRSGAHLVAAGTVLIDVDLPGRQSGVCWPPWQLTLLQVPVPGLPGSGAKDAAPLFALYAARKATSAGDEVS